MTGIPHNMPSGVYKRTKPNHWLGKKHTQATKDKIGEASKGKKLSEKHKLALINSNGFLGHKHSKETKDKIGLGNKGKKRSKEFKENISGKNHYNWKGGISKNPYPPEFNGALKLKIRTRDNFTCCLCSKTEREELEELNRVLAVNHIDFNKNNCKENNLNTLCVRCNVKINREREYWTNYFNNN